jgi:hypothetical protein
MRPGHSRTWKTLISSLALSALVPATARADNGMDKVVSPAVVASWASHDNADRTATTLLVLWRGTPGWFQKGSSSSGGSSGGGGFGSWSYSHYLTYGGLTLTFQVDFEKRSTKLANQEISLKDTNVVLVDFVDSSAGPTVVGYRWVEPGPPAPPLVEGAGSDPIAGVIRRSPELYEYLRCDVAVPDPRMNAIMPVLCGLIRGELPAGLKPR